MSIFEAIWNWIKSIFHGSDSPIKIGDHCYMPLFPRRADGGLEMTWNYLSWPTTMQAEIRSWIKSHKASNETPAITFCLTPRNINGGLIENDMNGLTPEKLNVLEDRCKELVKAGIAIFPCLYVDDSEPRWWQIKKHVIAWQTIHGKIGKYVTGYILSIESNEKAKSVGQLNDCINTMMVNMPGVDFYGTHLQWTANNGRYSWKGGASTPNIANIIFVEYSWDPNKGNKIGVNKMENEFNAITAAEKRVKLCHQEFNVDATGSVGKKQTEMLRRKKAWGIA